jgi:hypothetical protein
MNSAASLLSFSTPTHIEDFGNYNIGYGRSKTAFVQSLADHQKSDSSTGSKLRNSFRTWRGLQFLRLSFFLFD